jgi:hypothetical protein
MYTPLVLFEMLRPRVLQTVVEGRVVGLISGRVVRRPDPQANELQDALGFSGPASPYRSGSAFASSVR